MGSTVFAIGSNLNNLNNGNYTGVNPADLSPSNSTVNFLVNAYGAYINGYVYAQGGSFTGAVYANSFQLLNGATIPYSSISGTPTIPDPADFTVNGITGPVTWNEKTYNVCLSSSNSLLCVTISFGRSCSAESCPNAGCKALMNSVFNCSSISLLL